MLNSRQCYEKWRGQHPWSDWCKPTLFAQNFPSTVEPAEPSPEAKEILSALRAANISGAEGGGTNALVLDLPADDALTVSLSLTGQGFLPVPLYNGAASPSGVPAVLDNSGIQKRLLLSAETLVWPSNGGPAFLLDSRRMSGKAEVGVFDNRWITMAQDYPSGRLLSGAGIKKCFVVSASSAIGPDLTQVLFRWQQEGIQIFQWANDRFEPVHVKRPGLFQRLFGRVWSLQWLRPAALVGFGAIVGESTGG